MKKVLGILSIVLLLISCEAPYQITHTITKDSTGKEVHVITKTYNNSTTIINRLPVTVYTNPYWDNYGHYYSLPYYNSTPYYIQSPRIVVPITPHHTQRGARH